jgi:hypothetical protein
MPVCMYVSICPSQCLFFCVCLSPQKYPLSCLPASMSFLCLSLCKTVFRHFSVFEKYVLFISVYLSVCLSVRLYLFPPVSMASFLCLYVRLSVCPPVSISSSLCLRLSVCPLVCLSTHLDLCLHAYSCLSVSMLSSMCLSVCESFSMSLYLCLSVCLCQSHGL